MFKQQLIYPKDVNIHEIIRRIDMVVLNQKMETLKRTHTLVDRRDYKLIYFNLFKLRINHNQITAIYRMIGD